MSSPPPNLEQLSYLFGGEPMLLDPGVPWIYNTLSFRTERDGFVVTCELSPSYSTLEIVIIHDGRDIARAKLSAFTSLEIMEERGREVLTARFGDENQGAVWLSLKPHVQLTTSV